VKILAELISDPKLSFTTLHEASPPRAASVGIAVYEQLCKRIDPAIAGERVWAVAQFVVHIAADRARIQDDPDAAREVSPDEQFVDNLVAMAYGALVGDVESS